MVVRGAVGAPPVKALRLGALLAVAVPAAASAQALVPAQVRLDSLGALTQLAREGFEVAGVSEIDGQLYATVIATLPQQLALSALGFRTTAGEPVTPAPAVTFRGYEATLGTVDSLAALGSVRVDTIGLSVEGRPVVAAKVGAPDDAPSRPNVLFLGGHHAREWISVEMALRLLEHFATPGNTPAAHDVWVIPVVNPDGYAFSFTTERLWRKNRRANGDGSFGVDLNRNYPAFWGNDDVGSSPVAQAETYRGPGPGSEPETQAVMAFHASHPPAVSVSYHSYSDLVLYPYAHLSGALSPDVARFREWAGTPLAPAIRDRLAESARQAYYPGPGWQLYATNGDYTEWAYRAHGTLAVTVELTAGCCINGSAYGFVFPDDSTAVARVFADNLPFAEAALAAAAAPPATTAWESLWPEARLLAPAGASPMASVTAGGSTRPLALTADSLDRGTTTWRWRGPLADSPVGLRVDAGPGAGRVEVVHAAGAETEAGWTGWARESGSAPEGEWVWVSTNDTLRSPVISLAGVTRPRLVVWVRHEGSLFLPGRFATVDVSTDGGASWTPVARLEGAASAWYPVTAVLPEVPQARVRIVANAMTTRVDAVHVFGDVASSGIAVATGELGVSENPVRSSRVFFSWEAGTGDGRLSVFTLTGLLVHQTGVALADGLVSWDLTDRDGNPVGNGAYAAVLERGSEILRKRLFVARGF
jgi:hypothetical protein